MPLYNNIKDMPIFKHFSEEEKKSFAEMEHSMLGFNKGDTIIKEGERFTSIYVLIKGTILITKTGYKSPIAKLGSGAVFGEMSYLTKKPRFNNVIANEKVMVLKMDDEFFRRATPKIKEKIKDYLIEVLIDRLNTMNESLSKIARYAQLNLLDV